MPGSPTRFVRRLGGPSDRRVTPGVGVDPESVWLSHERFPGWEFGVEFTDDAQVSGLFVRAAAASPSLEEHARELAGMPARRVVPAPMTTRFMREIPWAEIEVDARDALRRARAAEERDTAAEWHATDASGAEVGRGPVVPGAGPGTEQHRAAARRSEAAQSAPISGRQPGPTPAPDEDFATVAQLYVQALHDPATRRKPVQAVAGRLICSIDTARGKVAECRARGLLTPATRGRASGELTPYARELLGLDQED